MNTMPGYIPMTHHRIDTPRYARKPIEEPRPRCANTNKKIFQTKADAGRWIITNNCFQRFNIYQCDFCNKYHLATKKAFKK